MMRRTRVTIVSALLALLVGASACGAPSAGSEADHGDGHDHGTAVSGTATPATGAHNDADVDFAAMMIPHHQQAVQMSDLMLAKSGVEPEVVDLARRIKDAQAPEITRMSGWLAGWGNPSPSMAMDHGDMGMMTAAQLQALEQAGGEQAQQLFLAGMIKHHQGAVAMAQTELASGANAEATALAQSIVTSQQAEITQMQQLLGN